MVRASLDSATMMPVVMKQCLTQRDGQALLPPPKAFVKLCKNRTHSKEHKPTQRRLDEVGLCIHVCIALQVHTRVQAA
eukprot:1160255-Pelagomonas_calceolata.AAC.7